MTAYRFRMKFERNPSALWRDIVVGADRGLAEFQAVLNRSVGLNQRHLWFFGADRDYWESDVQYLRPGEFDASPVRGLWGGTAYDAGETTIGEMVRELNVETQDCICYLFDYGDEWRFYGRLTEIDEDADSERPPEVVNQTGEPIEQYAPPEERR